MDGEAAFVLMLIMGDEKRVEGERFRENVEVPLRVVVAGQDVVVAEDEVDFEVGMLAAPMAKLLHFAVVMAVEEIAGNDEAGYFVALDYEAEAQAIGVLHAAGDGDAVLAKMAGFAPVYVAKDKGLAAWP